MYRVSREGRRAHDHDPDSNGGGRSSRYNKERVVNAASSSPSSSFAYSDDKSKAFPAAGGAAGGLRTRNSRASLCLKLTATSVGLFLLRGVHRSMCPAGEGSVPKMLTTAEMGSREAELQSRIASLDQRLEVERALRKTAEYAMEDLRANDRGRAGMPGSGGSDEWQQRGAEEEAEQAGLEEQAASHESEPLVHVAGEGQPNTVVTKGDYQALLRETYEDLEERIQELQTLTAKNKDLQEKVASLEEQVESRRQLALGVHGAEGVGGSYHQEQEQQQQQQWPEAAENDSNLGIGKPSTVKHRFGVGNFQHSDMAIFANGGISNNNNNNNNNNNDNDNDKGARGGTAKRTFYENPNDAYEGHQSNEPGVPFEVKGWIIEGEEGDGGGASADFDAGGSMDRNSNSGGGGEHSDPLADVDVGAVTISDGDIHEVRNLDAGGDDNEAPPIIVGGRRPPRSSSIPLRRVW